MIYKLIAIVGFIILAASPSFVDWQQSPEYRPQIAGYYGMAALLIAFGLDGWRGS